MYLKNNSYHNKNTIFALTSKFKISDVNKSIHYQILEN